MDAVRLKYSSQQDVLEELKTIDKDSLKEPRPKKGKKGKKPAAGAGGAGSRKIELMKALKESPCSGCPEFENHLKQINSKAGTQKEMNKMVKNVKDEVLLKSSEFNNKMRVLKELGFITKEDTLTLKGKFAQHLSSADIVILTIFVFEGGFIDLKDEEMIA